MSCKCEYRRNKIYTNSNLAIDISLIQYNNVNGKDELRPIDRKERTNSEINGSNLSHKISKIDTKNYFNKPFFLAYIGRSMRTRDRKYHPREVADTPRRKPTWETVPRKDFKIPKTTRKQVDTDGNRPSFSIPVTNKPPSYNSLSKRKKAPRNQRKGKEKVMRTFRIAIIKLYFSIDPRRKPKTDLSWESAKRWQTI